jgi:hypothetical protein
MNEVNKLKKEYEYANDFKYDWVVRCRSDTIINSKLYYERFDPRIINYSSVNNQPDGMICDWLNWGGSVVMDSYMSVFPIFDIIMAKCLWENQNAYCPEMLNRKMLDCFGIRSQGYPIHVGLPRY